VEAGTAVAVVGVVAVVGMVAGGAVAVFAADTTAVVGTGMLATIDGTEAGVGGAAVGTRGGFFRYRYLTLIRITAADTTVQDMDMDRVMGTGMDRVTVTDTESFELVAFLTSRRR
jgi:L-asparagine transporter-like permease